MVNNIKMRYDDDLKIFLTTCLRKIDYFSDSSFTEIELIHVAMHMMAMQEDKDALIIDSKKPPLEMKESLIIVYQGTL